MVPTIFAVGLAAAAFLFTLWVRPEDIPETPPPSPVEHLEERKARIYENLRDLQFEYRLGKLSDDDYQKTKVGLQRELSAVLAQIDAVQPASAAVAKPAAKAAAAPSQAPVQPRTTGTVCPHCSAKFATPLRFCGECGKAMG